MSGFSWMAGNWRSSSSSYLIGGRPAGDLDDTATVLMGNANNSLVIRIATSDDKGKSYVPGEMIVLHASSDGKSTRAWEIVEIEDDPLKVNLVQEGDKLTLTCPSTHLTTPQGDAGFSDEIVIEKKSNDRWSYSSDVTYTIEGHPITISQSVTFDRTASSRSR